MTLALNEQRPLRILSGCACGYWHNTQATPAEKIRVIRVTLVLLGSLFATELAIALQSHSLSLLADAGHLLSDVAAMGITLLAVWLAQRPASDRATFGHQRLEILAALLNGLGLLAIAAYITWEGLERFQHPQEVLGLPMLIGAAIGLFVNSLNMALLWHHSRDDLNLKGAFLHVVSDAASSVGVIIASLAIYYWHWTWMDATASLLVAGLTGLSALPLIQQSLNILLEYAPKGIDPAAVKAAMVEFEAVQQVEQLRIWSITSGEVILTAQVKINAALDGKARDRLMQQLQNYLKQNLPISEVILQLESDRPIPHPLFTQNLTSHVLGKTRSAQLLRIP
jgi:cobalt-zinc-cadmium efflux system protein